MNLTDLKMGLWDFVTNFVLYHYFLIPDIKPPEIDYCPAKIEKIAPALETSMTVSWILPNASDNSGLKPVIQQMSGLDSGSVFDEGLTSISYIANDTEGNVSPPCLFDIIIKGIIIFNIIANPRTFTCLLFLKFLLVNIYLKQLSKLQSKYICKNMSVRNICRESI